MNTPLSAVANTHLFPNYSVNDRASVQGNSSSSNEKAKNTALTKMEHEEVDHPFADIEGQYAGETVTRAEAEKIWDEEPKLQVIKSSNDTAPVWAKDLQEMERRK